LEAFESMKWNRFRRTLALLPLLAGTTMFAQGGPSQGGANQGAQVFSLACAGCHGADGSGGPKGPAIATIPAIIALPDAALIRIVHDGVPGKGMPAMPQIGEENTQAVVQYLRKLQGVTNTPAANATLTGDPDAGRTVYFGKGQCSSCHMVSGDGGFIASDLTAYGQRRDASAILQAIVTPDKQLAPSSRLVEVRTREGQSLAGVVRYEDNINIGLQTQDGRYHFLTRSGLIDVKYTDHSLMPRDYGTRLTDKELNDVVSFLIVTGRNAPAQAAPARRGRRGDN
jgi:cytochrome c oxidase cbb3-type subunit 3